MVTPYHSLARDVAEGMFVIASVIMVVGAIVVWTDFLRGLT